MKILKSTGMNYVELDLQKTAESEKAILVSDGLQSCWIPKSQLEDDPELLENGLFRIIIPQWLAEDKELV